MTSSSSLLADLPAADAWPSATAAMPTQTHAWTQARWRILPPAAARHLLACQDADGTQALAPLVRAGGWLREPPTLFEPSDFIWRDPAGLQRLADALAAQPLPVDLERLPAQSPTLPALQRAYAGRGILLVRPAMATPVIHLAGRGPDADAWFNAGRRSDFRRLERRAAAFGTATYELHAPATAEQAAALLHQAYAVEARSWKSAAGTALTADATQGAFFRLFAPAAGAEGFLRIAFLRIEGQAVAMQIAAEWQQRFWLFKITHDQAFAPCSPGQLLLRHTLRHAAARGLLSYEFMGLMAPWTELWTRDTREYLHVRAIPFSVAALIMAARSGARAALRPLRRLARP